MFEMKLFLICCIFTTFLINIYAQLRNRNNDNGLCHCETHTCGCCKHVDERKLRLNTTVCVNFTYVPEQLGIDFTVSIGGKIVFNKTVSASNPPPICFKVPDVKFASICIKFHDMIINQRKLHGCVGLEATVFHEKVLDIEFGCFDIISYSGQLIPWRNLSPKESIYVLI